MMYRQLLLIAASTSMLSCSSTAEKVWDDVLSKCADTEIGNSWVYFGPSNVIGPGSVWRKTDDGGYNVRWLVSDLEDAGVPSANFVTEGRTGKCQGSNTTTVSVRPSLVFETRVEPIGGELAATIDKARAVTVEVDEWSMDLVREGPFERWLRQLKAADEETWEDLAAGNRLVIAKSIRASGLKATLEFDSSVVGEVKATLNSPTVKLASLGVGLDVAWTSDTTLELTSPSEFYLVGEFSPLSTAGRFPASGGGSDVKIIRDSSESVAPSASLGSDRRER